MTLRIRYYNFGLSLLLSVSAAFFSVNARAETTLTCAELLKTHHEQNHVWTNWEEAKPRIPKNHSATLLLKIPTDSLSLSVQELVDPSWIKGTSVDFIREFSVLDRQHWFSIVNGDLDSFIRMDQLLSPAMRSKLQYISLETRENTGRLQLPVPAKMIEVDVTKESLEKVLKRVLPSADQESVALYAGGHFLMGVPRDTLGILPAALMKSLEISELNASADLNLMSESSKYIINQPSHTLFSGSAFRALKAYEGQSFNLGPMTADEAYLLLQTKLSAEPCKAAVCVTPIVDMPDISELVLAWRTQSGVGWAEKNFLDKSLPVMLEKFLPVSAHSRILAIRAAQTEGLSDGEMLRRIAKKEKAGAPVLARFTELWKAFALALDPNLEGDVFSKENQARILERLASGKNTSAVVTSADPEPKMEKALEKPTKPKAAQTSEKSKKAPKVVKPVKAVTVNEGTLGAESLSLIAAFVLEQTGKSYYKSGQLPIIFSALVDKVANGDAAALANEQIAEISFGDYDSTNSRKAGSAQRRVLLGLRVIAGLVSPALARAPSNDEWVANVIQSFERSISSQSTSMIRLSNQAVLIPRTQLQPQEKPQVAASSELVVPREQMQAREQLLERPQGPLSSEVIVRGVRDFGSYENVIRSEHFAKFMRDFAYLALPRMEKTTEFETVYIIPGDDLPTLVNFSIQNASHGGVSHLNVTKVEGTTKEQEAQLYFRMAKVHRIPSLTVSVANKRLIGHVKATDFRISSKVYLKLQVKHRLNENKIKKLLNMAINFKRGDSQNFSSDIELDGIPYKLFVFVLDNQVEVQTLYPVNSAKIKR